MKPMPRAVGSEAEDGTPGREKADAGGEAGEGGCAGVGWAMRDHWRAEVATSAPTVATRRQRPGGGLVHRWDRGV